MEDIENDIAAWRLHCMTSCVCKHRDIGYQAPGNKVVWGIRSIDQPEHTHKGNGSMCIVGNRITLQIEIDAG